MTFVKPGAWHALRASVYTLITLYSRTRVHSDQSVHSAPEDTPPPGLDNSAVRRAGSRGAALLLALALVATPIAGCAATGTLERPGTAQGALRPEDRRFLDQLERHTFHFFWETTDAKTGLAPDRWPSKSFVSVGAMGFALTAYPIGAERGWVTRAAAAIRTRTTLAYMLAARQDTVRAGATGYKGFFYHFRDPATGHRFERVELSTQDTAMLLAGALFCQSYFDRDTPVEAQVRALAESLYVRADWQWASVRPPTISLGWNPEGGHLPYDYRGYNETMILYLLALGSPTHPIEPAAWSAFTAHYQWGRFENGDEHLGFAPLFGHQYSHVWVDFRGIQDSTMRARGIDYFENSRRATRAQQAYAVRNPGGFRGYGADAWGLTACDGPLDTTFVIAGRERRFHTYNARGASFTNVEDDGTLSPTAIGGSIPFEPELTVTTLRRMKERYGEPLYGRYGFVDAFNPTFDAPVRVQHGRVVPGVGWFDTDYLGIDQGPILAMIENHRSGLVWNTMRKNPHLVRGLRRAGFTGGWLDSSSVAR
jgi:hypothetical protein